MSLELLAHAALAQGRSVCVALRPSAFADRLEEAGARVARIAPHRRRASLRPADILRLASLTSEVDDWVLINGVTSSVRLIPGLMRSRTPAHIVLHHAELSSMDRAGLRMLQGLALKPRFYIVSSSQSSVAEAIAEYGFNVEPPLGNPVEMPSASSARRTTPHDGIRILHVSGLRTSKGLAPFMEVVEQLRHHSPGRIGGEVRIVGVPPEHPLAQRLLTNGTGGSPPDVVRDRFPVRLVGWTGDMALHYRWCDVVVLTSTTETFGRAAVEALSYGRPVIATGNAGLSALVREGAPISVVRHGQERTDMPHLICDAVADRPQAFLERREFAQRFSPESILRRIDDARPA